MSDPEEPKEHGEGWDSRGSYLLNAIYVVLFLLFYLVLFWQLSQRWGIQ